MAQFFWESKKCAFYCFLHVKKKIVTQIEKVLKKTYYFF